MKKGGRRVQTDRHHDPGLAGLVRAIGIVRRQEGVVPAQLKKVPEERPINPHEAPNMNPKIIAAAALCSAMLCGCSTFGPPAGAANPSSVAANQFMNAIRRQVACADKREPKVDDGISDATTIALALSVECGREYDAVTRSVTTFMLHSQEARKKYEIERARPIERAKAFVPQVLLARRARNSGRNRSGGGKFHI